MKAFNLYKQKQIEMRSCVLIPLCIVLMASCSGNSDKEVELVATAVIESKNESGISGTVTFTEIDGEVLMKAKIKGLKPGDHAIHIHAVGDCSSADGSSASGHWNPTNTDHGKWGTAPFHIGDIGNIEADADGNGTFTRETDLWCIDCDDATYDIVGKAIIIHAGPDDFSSQPAGAAGDRIGCGEIILDKK